MVRNRGRRGRRADAAVEGMSRAGKDVVRRKGRDLAEMLMSVSQNNLHAEVDFGPPAGREEW